MTGLECLMPLFPDVAFPSDDSVLPRLPTDAEWVTAYAATEGATAAWQAAQAAPTTETAGWPEPRVEDFLPRETGGEGLVWPPAAPPLPVVVDIEPAPDGFQPYTAGADGGHVAVLSA